MTDQHDAHKRVASLIFNYSYGTDEVAKKSAESGAKDILRDFILIRKADLPALEPKQQGWGDLEVMMARTVGYRGRKPEIYWSRALDFISVALYAEQEEAKQAERELAGMRNEAYNMLYPTARPLWDYDSADLQVKTKIDVVVNLMRQVDELKSTK